MKDVWDITTFVLPCKGSKEENGEIDVAWIKMGNSMGFQ